MDEDDHDELLQCSDEESMSESDDQCIPVDKPEEVQVQNHTFTAHTKTEFLLVKLCLILSSTGLLILLPLFQESINVKSDVYTLIYFTTSMSVVVLLVMLLAGRKICSQFFDKINITKPPFKVKDLVLTSCAYVLSGFIVIHAIDRKRVLCHLQDPIKGLVLVFSLIYYFFFCKKLMGLQRIFSTTTIIVGLFISVDYGLCDEFRCRGNDREHRSDDAGNWTWQTHTVWAGVYIAGLSLFSIFYMLLDRHLISSTVVTPYTSLSSHLLTTVSRLVSFQSMNNSVSSQTRSLTTTRINKKIYSAIHVAFWLHVFTWMFTVSLFWTDVIPSVGKSNNMQEFFNHTTSGLICIFTSPAFFSDSSCSNASTYAWLFLMVYLVYTVSSLRFLILSQSAVYTVATMTVSLPLVGIWWSLFKLASGKKDLLMWSPTISGELICALLGLPIVLIGLVLLCKSHFRDCQILKVNPNSCVASTHLA